MSLTPDLIAALTAVDTPTICNALEVAAPGRRSIGFNRSPLTCPFPAMKPVVGHARTATVRSREAGPASDADKIALRLAYYEYIERGPRPSLALIQDIDGAERGLGAFWGEVQSTVHVALGCAGVVTDGAIRDLDMWAKGFFALAGSVMPSHVHADLVDFDKPVTVAGMLVAPGDIVHADRHGAAVIPADVVADIPKICDLLARKEKVILDAARKPGFSTADIRAAFATMKDIH
jgi:regulator of RNase E activity RraA